VNLLIQNFSSEITWRVAFENSYTQWRCRENEPEQRHFIFPTHQARGPGPLSRQQAHESSQAQHFLLHYFGSLSKY